MKERTISVGGPVALQGVCTEPEQFDADRPAILLLNSGVMHRVGACRLSVRLARSLAQRGYLCVRFDGSGLGDSEPRHSDSPTSSPEVAIAETREVMDHLQLTRGISRFVLYGLCSGAHTSFNTACKDDRVVGIAMIDPFCYRTWRYYWYYMAPRLVSARHWRGLILRQLARLKKRSAAHAELEGLDLPEFFEVPEFSAAPPRADVAAGLRGLVARSVRMHVCFTGGTSYYNYARQYTDSFADVDFSGLLTLRYFPESNHIMTQAPVQKEVVQGIVSWASSAPPGDTLLRQEQARPPMSRSGWDAA